MTPGVLPAEALPGFVDAVPPGGIRVLAVPGVAALRDVLAVQAPLQRPLLCVDLPGGTVGALLGAALDGVARAVMELWPYAWGGEDFSDVRLDPLSRAYLPHRLAALALSVPGLLPAWAGPAVLALVEGGPPRIGAPAGAEWGQLVRMLAPGGLVLAVAHGAQPPAVLAAALQWLAAHAPVSVLLLVEALPQAVPPWDRLLYGARTLDADGAAAGVPGGAGALLLGAPAVEGRPHPLSAVELRLYRQIQLDAELQPLFGFNVTVEGLVLLQPRVDLLWRGGLVVVELDGDEHRGAARYRADRDRDHRLMCGGYRVLRLTNDEVMEDCLQAVEKIRQVVRLAKRSAR